MCIFLLVRQTWVCKIHLGETRGYDHWTKRPEFLSIFFDLFSVWTWASCLRLVHLYFLICTMGRVKTPFSGCLWENWDCSQEITLQHIKDDVNIGWFWLLCKCKKISQWWNDSFCSVTILPDRSTYLWCNPIHPIGGWTRKQWSASCEHLLLKSLCWSVLLQIMSFHFIIISFSSEVHLLLEFILLKISLKRRKKGESYLWFLLYEPEGQNCILSPHQ